MSATIRRLTVADLPAALSLSQAAGWNQKETDWRNLLRLAPETCFALELDGVLAATTTAICYQRTLAWIGMVLTDSLYRRRGFARRLLEHTLQALAARQVECIQLDATEMGAPLYRALGFTEQSAIERWSRPPGPSTAPTAFSYEPCYLLDRDTFGADRSRLLETLAPFGAASIPNRAYAMSRPGSQAAYFGPCVSRSPEAARGLLAWFLASHAGQPAYWDLLPSNAAAVGLARDHGFAPVRRLARMALSGTSVLARNDSQMFAIAGFEFG